MEYYTDQMNKYRLKYEEWLELQELSATEKEKWLSWYEVNEIPDRILEAHKKETDPTAKFLLYQDYLIMCLYTMIAPKRRDYAPMDFCTELPEGHKLAKVAEDKARKSTVGTAIKDLKNYCCLLRKDESKKKADKDLKDTDFDVFFILNSYKTSWSYGRAEFWATPQLVSVIRKWRELNLWKGEPCGAFLRMRGDTDQMMTVEALGTRVGFLCETYSTRKRHATINTLRHSYIHFRDAEERNEAAGQAPARRRYASRRVHGRAVREGLGFRLALPTNCYICSPSC